MVLKLLNLCGNNGDGTAVPGRMPDAAAPCLRDGATAEPSPHLHTNPLQMFARELHSGWTSWGNEVLKLQSASRFERLPEGAAGL